MAGWRRFDILVEIKIVGYWTGVDQVYVIRPPLRLQAAK
jgi:hypothetical protein